MKNRFQKLTFALLLCGLIPFCSSCVSTSIGRALADQLQYDLKKGQFAEDLANYAIVVGSISQPDGKKYESVSFLLSNNETDNRVIIEMRTTFMAESNLDFKDPEIGTVYAYKVPAGSYDFSPVSADLGMNNYRATAPLPESTWNLEAGKIYYLGNSHLTVLTKKALFGNQVPSDIILDTRNNWDFDKKQLLDKYPWLKLEDVELLKAETINDGKIILLLWNSTVIY